MSIIYFTIPKGNSIDYKIEATKKADEFAYYKTSIKPTRDFTKACMLHRGIRYYFEKAWYDPEYGICYTGLVYTEEAKTAEGEYQKGFQGIRYLFPADFPEPHKYNVSQENNEKRN